MNATQSTRRESYDAIKPKAAARRQLILEALGNRQMIAHELTELLLRGQIKFYDRNFVSPRLTELKAAGVVTTVGKRLCAKTGKNVAVWTRTGVAIVDETVPMTADGRMTGASTIPATSPASVLATVGAQILRARGRAGAGHGHRIHTPLGDMSSRSGFQERRRKAVSRTLSTDGMTETIRIHGWPLIVNDTPLAKQKRAEFVARTESRFTVACQYEVDGRVYRLRCMEINGKHVTDGAVCEWFYNGKWRRVRNLEILAAIKEQYNTEQAREEGQDGENRTD